MNKLQKTVILITTMVALAACAGQQRAAQPAASAPTVAAPTDAPKAAAPTDTPAVAAPTEAPKAAAPTDTPAAAAPTDAPKAAAPTSGDVIEVNVKMSEFEFKLDKTSFPAGKVIRFNIDNVGQREHEMIVELTNSIAVPLEANGKKAEATEVASGQKVTLDWVFDKPGKYLLGCHVGKHFERGMKLEIDVTG